MLGCQEGASKIGGVLNVRAGLICAVLLGAAFAGCGGDDDDGGKATANDGASTAAQSDDSGNPPLHARVEITKNGYKPRNVRILVGGTVTFVNVDRTAHTAETQDLGGGANDPEAVTDNNEFDTHTLVWEEPYTITFHKPEKVEYHDAFSEMTGTVEAVPKY